MGKQTQEARVLEYMKDFGSISTWEAFRDLGVTRLASRIHDLSRKGHEICSKYYEDTNRYGETVRYKRYWIKDEGWTN